MAELVYSDEAESVLNLFYGVDTIVYVEGIDDVPFWEIIFKKFANYSVEINDVGGVTEIKKYIEKIEGGQIQAIVACDADFSYAKSFSQHHNIIRTYGYSIENSMICEKTLQKVVKAVGRLTPRDLPGSAISDWIEELYLAFKDLVFTDIVNEITQAGKTIGGDNCTRFMKSKKSANPCPQKITSHLNNIDITISAQLKNQIINSVTNSGRSICDCIRGHFLFSASLKYIVSEIKKHGRQINVSNDTFFGTLLLAFEAVFNDSHNHFDHYKCAVQGTVVSV